MTRRTLRRRETSPHRPDAAAGAHRRTLLLLVAVQVVGGLSVGASIPVGGLLAADLAGSTAWAGASAAAVTLGAALTAVPLSRIAARHGRRKSLVTGWSLAAVGASGVGLSAAVGSFALFLVGMLLFGAGLATSLQSRYAATDTSRPGRRARDLSTVVWATTVGAVVGPVVAAVAGRWALAVGAPQLAGPFAISACGAVIAALLLQGLLRPGRLGRIPPAGVPDDAPPAGEQSPVQHPERLAARLATLMRDARTRCAMTATVLSHAVMVVLMSMVPIHLAHVGSDLTAIGTVLSMHLAGMYAAAPLFGWLTDRLGARSIIVVGQILLAGAVVLVAAGPRAHVALAAGLVAAGLGWSASLIAASTMLTESVRDEDRPAAQGVSDTSMNLLGAVAVAGAGPVVHFLGFQPLAVLAGLLIPPVLVATRSATRSPTVSRSELPVG